VRLGGGAAKNAGVGENDADVTHIETQAGLLLRRGRRIGARSNTIRSVCGVNLETLRPEPSVEALRTPWRLFVARGQADRAPPW